MNAVIRYHYKINPTELSDESWAKFYNEWLYVKKWETKNAEQIMKSALLEVASKLIG